MFCKLWSEKYLIFENNIFIIFNHSMPDDYYFNRLSFSNFYYNNDFNLDLFKNKLKNILKVIHIFNIHNIFLYIDDSWMSINYYLSKNNCFKKIDKITTLMNDYPKFSNPYLNEQNNPSMFQSNRNSFDDFYVCETLRDWFSIYCTSFDIQNCRYRKYVWKILQNNLEKFKFIRIFTKDNITIGCCLLYPYKDVLGLYCLGIHQKYRFQGFASKIIKYSINFMIENNFQFITLQTLESDNLLSFYEKNGFRKIHSSSIYSFLNS